jgi:beta-lactamase class A
MHVSKETARIAQELSVDIAFTAKNLTTGEEIQHNGDTFQTMGSLMKLPIAIALLDLVDQGKLSLDDMHKFEARDMRFGGWLTEPLVQQKGVIALSTYTVIDAALRMSDNAAWQKMLEICGGIATVQQYLSDNQITQVRSTDTLFDGYAELLESWGYSHAIAPSLLKPSERQTVLERFLTDMRDACTPQGMVGLLGKLYRGELLSEVNTTLLLEIMKSCETSENKLRAMLPPGIVVADKTGSIASLVAADAGFVFLPGNGTTIAIAVFSRTLDVNQDGLDKAIANIGRLVCDYFILNSGH